MAAAKKPVAPAKLPVAEARKLVETQQEELDKLKNDSAWCYLCGIPKRKEKFHVCTDPLCKSGVARICKQCARSLGVVTDEEGNETTTKESMILALRYLDKPFLKTVWDASIQESDNLVSGKVRSTPYDSYVKNIAMVNYLGKTFADSDFFKKMDYDYEDKNVPKENVNRLSAEDVKDFEKNKLDVIKLLGYDPFEAELADDQPFLYSQLIGLMDTGGDENDDMLRNSSCITIVRGFLQASKIDNTITNLMMETRNIEKNSATIKSLQDSKQKIMSMITNLAAESCISLKNNKNAKKGENTWTGKIKKIKDINLREGEVNGFDIDTCRGMQQVQEISDASIMKQLALDESEWSDMVAEMRVTNTTLRREKDAYQEINRIILRENLDLRDTLKENELLNESNLSDLKDLYSVFAEFEQSDDEGGESDESE